MSSAIRLLAILITLNTPIPSHAFWGFLGKLGQVGKVAPKALPVASVSSKMGARAGGAVAASQLPETVASISKASGLGKAVPDDIAAMMRLPARKLEDIPDAGTRSWLTPPPNAQAPNDSIFMIMDYARLVKGRPALGPQQKSLPFNKTPTPAFENHDPAKIENIPWHAVELMLRAAHLGNDSAILERKRLCLDHKSPSGLKNLPDCRI